MVYCDYTASGRCLRFIENYLMRLQRQYANTHTEDDVTGRSMSHLLKQAEEEIKESVNAGPSGKIIACGYGSTAAIVKLQQILGVHIPPAAKKLLINLVRTRVGDRGTDELLANIREQRPVVFIGGYEHHSNELSWRESLVAIEKIGLDSEGKVDCTELEAKLQKTEYRNRLLIGSFSAASNVTGIISPVHTIAAILHRCGALACFDFAASAPYVEIDMNPGDPEAEIDAIFISPHKFLGGPGSVGILVFNERLYDRHLPPTVSGGGTVDYVGPDDQDYLDDIEEREKAGTPGVLQTLKASLAFLVKDTVTSEQIARREEGAVEKAFTRWAANKNIEILGNSEPKARIPIVSFTVHDPWGRYLHPKFITVLLNDLFGIQSRAGCSCAGPYGHFLLGIDHEGSEKYRTIVRQGYTGIKPGWCRVGFHYVMDDPEVDYIIECVDFIGSFGYRFIPDYHFDVHTGSWTKKGWMEKQETFGIEAALDIPNDKTTELSKIERKKLYKEYLSFANHEASRRAHVGLKKTSGAGRADDIDSAIGGLRFFTLPEECVDIHGLY